MTAKTSKPKTTTKKAVAVEVVEKELVAAVIEPAAEETANDVLDIDAIIESTENESDETSDDAVETSDDAAEETVVEETSDDAVEETVTVADEVVTEVADAELINIPCEMCHLIPAEARIDGVFTDNYELHVPQEVADIITVPGWHYDNALFIPKELVDYIATVKWHRWRGHTNVKIVVN